jgi:hypothetical protein
VKPVSLGYASDPNSLSTLVGEMSEAQIATGKFRHDNHKLNPMGNKTDVTTSYMLYAYDAMYQMIQTEIDRYVYLPNSDVPIRLAEKYEEIWKMIDPFIPVVPTIPAQ